MSYKLTHPETGQAIEVEADMVEVYETQGWETAPTAKTPAKADEK